MQDRFTGLNGYLLAMRGDSSVVMTHSVSAFLLTVRMFESAALRLRLDRPQIYWP
jgi:hypothetical protein